jgi:hypothetical protein
MYRMFRTKTYIVSYEVWLRGYGGILCFPRGTSKFNLYKEKNRAGYRIVIIEKYSEVLAQEKAQQL